MVMPARRRNNGNRTRERPPRHAQPARRPPSAKELDALFDAALDRRRALLQSGRTDAVRLVHGAVDGLDGLVIEQFGDVLFVQMHEGRWAVPREVLREPVERLCRVVRATSVYVKHFVLDRAKASSAQVAEHRASLPWIGQPAPAEFEIREDGRRYCIRPFDGFSVGLFLEHRDHRRRIGELAGQMARHGGGAEGGGAFVLNAFCYTCGFSIAAALGGAYEVTSVDLSKRYLAWGKRNFAANQVPLDQHRFICDDIRTFYGRARRQGRRYDLVILDPPTFARIKQPRGVFVLEDALEDLLAGAIDLLRPGGRVFFSTNHRGLPLQRIRQAITAAAAGRHYLVEPLPPLPLDFAGDADFSRALLVRFDTTADLRPIARPCADGRRRRSVDHREAGLSASRHDQAAGRS